MGGGLERKWVGRLAPLDSVTASKTPSRTAPAWWRTAHQWRTGHRGYLAGYHEGYDAGLAPVPAPKRALPWTNKRRT